MKIGSWNVRTFNVEGRLENTIREMKRNNISVLGICETHWEGPIDFKCGEYRIIGSSGDMKRHGVAIIMDEKTCGDILHVERISERLMMTKIKANPVDMMIIQVYMPTSQAKEEEVDEGEVQELGCLQIVKRRRIVKKRLKNRRTRRNVESCF